MYLGFPVTFGYLDTTVLKGGRNYTHRGIDLGSWVGDELRIQGRLVAITGNTGLTEGPHTHVQAGRDEWAQSTINPAPYIGKPGRVVKVGQGDEWGRYVAIRVGDVNVFYCHLQTVLVRVGDVISAQTNQTKGVPMITKPILNVLYRFYLAKLPLESDYSFYVGKMTVDQARDTILASDAYRRVKRDVKSGKLQPTDFLAVGIKEQL